MFRLHKSLSLLLCLCAMTGAAHAQGNPPAAAPQKPGDTIRIGAEEVLPDLVVRDKKGRPVNDLKPDEIEIYEAGVRQPAVGFRRVGKTGFTTVAGAAGATGSAANTPANSSMDPLRQINLVTLVFERLNQENRPLARDAAMEFLRAQTSANTMIAVFVLDQSLHIVQQFTNNRDLLAQAIERAAGHGAAQFAAQSEAIRASLESLAKAQTNVEMDVPMAFVRFISDEAKKTVRAHFSMLALVRDAQGAIVRKFSKDQTLEGAADKMAGLQQRSYVYENNFALAPGRYTLETIVQDREANKLSSRRAVLMVPAISA
ncbi:MAG: VWA domain-containing protein, partial [Blastocatellia bacterium]